MYKRFWLNAKEGRAFMEVEVKNESAGRKYIAAGVTFSDCSRMVTLDLDSTKATRNERLRKVRSMIAALQEVEAALAGYKFGKNGSSYD